jgi:hypothetical protein
MSQLAHLANPQRVHAAPATSTWRSELSAAIELRRLFPGVTDNAKARECARTIAGWQTLPAAPAKVIRLRPRGER